MVITTDILKSKIVARLSNESGRINKEIRLTVTDCSPDSVQVTGTIPRMNGWQAVELQHIPLLANKRKDYVRFLKETDYGEVWIRLSTRGGRSRIYVR